MYQNQMHPVDQWLATNNKFFPPEKIPYVRDALMRLPEQQIPMIFSMSFKDPTTMLIISILVGEFGVDRFMLGDIGLGVLKLLTLGGCGIWWIIDAVIIQNKTREVNFNQLMQTLQQYGAGHVPPQAPYGQ